MILAYHTIFTVYGFWPPNDPRGSWSDFVATMDLLSAAGKATKTNETQSLANRPHNPALRSAAKNAMLYPPVQFTGEQALANSQGFQQAIREGDYAIHACAILPDHVHLVLGRHQRDVKQIIGHLKSKATMRLVELGLHPLANFGREDGRIPTPWVEGCWKVFLNNVDDVAAAIEYVEQNPIRAKLRRQRWSFVEPFALG